VRSREKFRKKTGKAKKRHAFPAIPPDSLPGVFPPDNVILLTETAHQRRLKEEIMANLTHWDECVPLYQRHERRLEDDLNTPAFPSLCRPVASIRDPGTVRLGDGFITAEFPPQT